MKLRLTPKRLISVFILFLLVVFLATPALAFTSREGDQVVVAQGEVVNDDLYVGANTIHVYGTIEGDLVAFGSLVVIGETGVVEGDLLGAAQGVVVNGVVKDDVRVAGAVISVGKTAQIGGDLLAGGYSVETAAGSQIGQDVVAAGSMVGLSGTTARNVHVAAGGFALDGKVGGDVNTEVGSVNDVQQNFSPLSFMPKVAGMPQPVQISGGLTLGPNAQVAGKLNYTSPQPATLPAGKVTGGATYNPPPTPMPGQAQTKAQPPTAAKKTADWMLAFLRNLATLLLTGLVVSYFAPGILHKGSQVLKERPLPSFGWGILMFASFYFALLAIFIIVVILAVIFGLVTLGSLVGTVIGAGIVSFSAVILGFSVAASYVSKILVGYLLGWLLFSRLKPELAEHRFWPALVGILFFVILVAIPILGTIFNILAVLAGLGALYLAFRQWFKARREAAAQAPAETA
jgi:cytoskeletal protein CcmA (bactofilin family)